jgi:hypothetical protein
MADQQCTRLAEQKFQTPNAQSVRFSFLNIENIVSVNVNLLTNIKILEFHRPFFDKIGSPCTYTDKSS